MIHRWCLLSLCLLAATGLAPVPPETGPNILQNAPQARVERAFRSGDAQALLERAADRIEIALLGQGMLYSRAQARYVMQDFFRQYPPVHFRVQHASTTDGTWFGTGRYAYERAERPLQVYVRMQQRGRNHWEVREIRIEERLRD